MLGPGVYVSRNIEKAKCYPQKTDKMDKVVFKLRVRVGKSEENRLWQSSSPENVAQATGTTACGFHQTAASPPSSLVARRTACGTPSASAWLTWRCCVDDAKRHELRRMIRKKTKTEGCDLCHLDNSDGHDIQPCWECQEDICPFQGKHVCKKTAVKPIAVWKYSRTVFGSARLIHFLDCESKMDVQLP